MLRYVFLGLFAGPAFAESLAPIFPSDPCPEGLEFPAHIQPPLDDNLISYGDGEIEFAVVRMDRQPDTPLQVAVLHPPRDRSGQRQCDLVPGFSNGNKGFYGVDFSDQHSGHNQQDGIWVEFTATLSAGGRAVPQWISVDPWAGTVVFARFD